MIGWFLQKPEQFSSVTTKLLVKSLTVCLPIHLTKSEQKAQVVGEVTGIENEMAGLRLSLDLR